MRDLFFVGFLAAFLAFGLKRPFIWVLAYAYVDIIAPQRLSYGLLASLPISMLMAVAAIGGWALLDRKDGVSFSARQGLILLLLAYCGMTTVMADFPTEAAEKWAWVWKGLIFAVFLPFALRTRLRIEAYLLIMVLSAAAIIIVGGIKTAASGGGYGALNLFVENNTGLYEGSQISTVAVGIIPLILWFSKFGTVYPSDWRVKIFCYCLIFACLLIPVGTEARTGLVCIAVLAVLMLRDVKRRLLYIGMVGALGMCAIPLLPSSFTNRMETIQGYQADQSAGTRLAVWSWTLDYVRGRPMGGGFDSYLQNRIQVRTVEGASAQTTQDEGRAWHSAYFEMLGEQGFPGLALWLFIHLVNLIRMERLRRRYRKPEPGDEWIGPLASALQHLEIIYLFGALFVGIAFQPFLWMSIGCQIALDKWVSRREEAKLKAGRTFGGRPVAQARSTGAVAPAT